MTHIDYEALEKAFWDAQPNQGARAVVASLRDQGFVVVRKHDLRVQMVHVYGPELEYPWVSDQRTFHLAQSFERLRATLDAPGDGGEQTDG